MLVLTFPPCCENLSAGFRFFQGIYLIAISFVQYDEVVCISIKVSSLSKYYWEVDASEAGSSDVSDSLSEGSSISSIGFGLMKKR